VALSRATRSGNARSAGPAAPQPPKSGPSRPLVLPAPSWTQSSKVFLALLLLLSKAGEVVPGVVGHDSAVGLTEFDPAVRCAMLETSSDLSGWVPVSTNTAAAGELWFDNLSTPSNMQMFYRAVLVP
jgi:hypothetical protein